MHNKDVHSSREMTHFGFNRKSMIISDTNELQNLSSQVTNKTPNAWGKLRIAMGRVRPGLYSGSMDGVELVLDLILSQ